MSQLLPELAALMTIHDLDDMKITIAGDGYVRVFTFTEKLMYPLTLAGYEVWVYEGSEFLTKVDYVNPLTKPWHWANP